MGFSGVSHRHLLPQAYMCTDGHYRSLEERTQKATEGAPGAAMPYPQWEATQTVNTARKYNSYCLPSNPTGTHRSRDHSAHSGTGAKTASTQASFLSTFLPLTALTPGFGSEFLLQQFCATVLKNDLPSSLGVILRTLYLYPMWWFE